jgi:hypothetical protein
MDRRQMLFGIIFAAVCALPAGPAQAQNPFSGAREITVTMTRDAPKSRRATGRHLTPQSPRRATGKALTLRPGRLTLNHRVPGSSPGAPTKPNALPHSGFFIFQQ